MESVNLIEHLTEQEKEALFSKDMLVLLDEKEKESLFSTADVFRKHDESR